MNRITSLYYKHKKAISAVLIIGFVNFIYAATNLIYNNDTIGRLFRDPIESDAIGILSGRWHYPEIYKMTGRWFYPFVYNLVIDIAKVPMITLIVSLASLTVSCILIWEIFNIKDFLQKVLVGGIYITSPILIHFFFYEGDAEVYYFALFLITFSLYLYKNLQGILSLITPIVLIVLALACYPALYSYVTAIYIFYVIHLLYNASKIDKDFLMQCLKMVLICGIGIVLYFLCTKAILSYYNLEMVSYRNAKEHSILQVILQLPEKIQATYLLFIKKFKTEYFITQIVFILNVVALGYALINSSRNNVGKIVLGIFLLAILPIAVMSIYLIVFENILYQGFQFGFLIFYSLPIIFLFQYFSRVKIILGVVMFYFIFLQIQVSNRIAMEHQLNVEASKLFLSSILHDVQKHPDFDRGKVILFTGNISHNANYAFMDIIPQTEMMNFANAPVGFVFEGDYFITNMRGQIRTLGLNYNITYENTYKDLYIPEYPKEGSIRYLQNDTIMVNLGGQRSK